MLKHYFLVAWLNIRRSPLVAAINVLTLALGLFCFIFASSITGFWSRADRHFTNAERTFVITSHWQLTDGSDTGSGTALPLTTHQLAGLLESDFPRLEATARVIRLGETTPVRGGDRATRMRGFAADAQFLEIFDLPFIDGDARAALRAPRSVILTKEAARTLYGTTRVLGKPVTILGKVDATITGVIDRLPEPSHMGQSAAAPLRFDLLASRDVYEEVTRAFTGGRDTTQLPADWFNVQNTTYVMLPADGSLTAAQLRDQLPAFLERHAPSAQRKLARIELDIEPVSKLLSMAIRDALFPQQSATSVSFLLLAMGSIVLLVACVNFANLATARAAGREREVGVRRAIGARPAQVAAQYLLESGVLTLVALVLAMMFVAAMLPVLEANTGISLRTLWHADDLLYGVLDLLALAAVVTLAAGFYPAFVLSRVRPASAVRMGNTRTGSRPLMAVLVGVQFAFAAFLLIAVTIIQQQNEKLRRAGAEIDGHSLVVIENMSEITGLSQETLHAELSRLPQVLSDTAMETLPWTSEFRRIPLSSSAAASAVEQSALLFPVGFDFFRAFDIDLLAGRVFDPHRPDDFAMRGPGPTRTQNIIVSRRLAAELGFEDPSAIVDKTIYIPRSVTGETPVRPFLVIGVVEDKTLNIASRYGSRPNAYLFNPASRFHIVRIADANVAGALQEISSMWKRLVPHVSPDPRFVAGYFEEGYANFVRISQAFTVLAFIAWVISTIGLYAMAILISGRRMHEIAIRKTLGARTSRVVVMLLKSFTAPVMLANVIAWPFAYLAARAYLNVFIDPVSLTPWPFVVALVVSMAIALFAVGGQTWRIATLPPAKVMRYE